MELILIMTRRCNLRCKHCPVEMNKKNLSFENAKKSINILFEKNKEGDPIKIRFFGGEPFLVWDRIREIVKYAESKFGKAVFFDITTNGSLLTGDILKYFSQHDNFELIISYHRNIFDSKIKALLGKHINPRGYIFNIKINPDDVRDLSKNFISLYASKITRFNILPSYYTIWTDAAIRRMVIELNKIIIYIKLNGIGNVYLKNSEVLGDVPLFNTAMVVDCDGKVFSNNIVLDSRLGDRQSFYLGDVNDNDIDFGKLSQMKVLLAKVLSGCFPADILHSTRLIDDALTSFVTSFKNIRKYEKNN